MPLFKCNACSFNFSHNVVCLFWKREEKIYISTGAKDNIDYTERESYPKGIATNIERTYAVTFFFLAVTLHFFIWCHL